MALYANIKSARAGMNADMGGALVIGADGITPHIGENGNWWIGEKDTGVKAAGSDGKNGSDGKDGATPYIGGNNNWWIGETDTGVLAHGLEGLEGKQGIPGKSAYQYAVEAGYTELESTFARQLARQESKNYVTIYGAKGDGSTDDTEAFQAALEDERYVYVPGGTYVLSGELVIGDNCMLELAQDVVLEFTQTTGNCINLGMLSTLKGNHATVKVPYEFSGNVLYAYSNDHTEAEILKVPPFSRWDPQWKSGRYVTDINICKADSRGFHYAVNPGDCKGTAVYISADNTVGCSTFMWGVHYSGLRIAGAFAYGIHAQNFDKGWLHEMRIDAFITNCETGVCLEDCSQTYISAIIQPGRAYSLENVYVPYAKHGIKLVRSKNTDLSGSRVWDWNDTNTLWTQDNEYQHIAMYGDCCGAIINDFAYHTNGDTRKRIYTDYGANLETLTILQEPITRWFKNINGNPYYNDGIVDRQLITQEHLDAHFKTDTVKSFTDVLSTATDTDGTIYNKTGYKHGRRLNADGTVLESAYYTATGFIPITPGQTIYVKQMSIANAEGYCRICLYDKDKNFMAVHTIRTVLNSSYHFIIKETADGFNATINEVVANTGVSYMRFCVMRRDVGETPMAAIDEEIKYTIEGFLADGVKVKGENVIGNVGEVAPDWIATSTKKGGNNIVIPEQTVSGGMWKNLQMTLQAGIVYDVYINGVLYSCEARANGLGNNTAMTLNDYPFCIYWAGGSATSGMFYKDGTISSPVTLKVTDHAETVYDKMPAGYLPDEVVLEDELPDVSGMVKSVNGVTPDANGNVEVEGGVDVTAAVGQTIIVKEVDENGKPTAWEAVDRTHWSEETVGDLVPRTVFQAILHPQFDVYFYALPEFGLAAGKQYTVIFDDNEYNCTAVAATFDGMDIVTIGNTFFVDGVQSSEPFVVAKIPVMGATIVISLSLGYANTIQIIGEKTVYHTLPEYAPNEYWVSFLQTGVVDDEGSLIHHFSADWDELIAAIKARKNIYADMVYYRNDGSFIRQRYMLGFANIDVTPTTGFEWTDKLMFGVCHNHTNESIARTVFVYRWADGTVTVSGEQINVQPT